MIRKTRLPLAVAALLLAGPALAAADHEHGVGRHHKSLRHGPAALAAGDHEQGHGMSDDMTKMHQEMEARLADTSGFGTRGDPAQAARTVSVTASEIMFDVESLAIGVGETVRFVVTNDGEQPHEFTIGDAAYQEHARAMMAHMAEMGTDPASEEHAAMHETAGNTVVVPVGETREIVWTFTKAGRFEFSCNFVGHAEVGMVGTIIVG